MNRNSYETKVGMMFIPHYILDVAAGFPARQPSANPHYLKPCSLTHRYPCQIRGYTFNENRTF